MVFYALWRIQSVVKGVREKPDAAAAFEAPAAGAPRSISLL
jgi:hypothetical protein